MYRIGIDLGGTNIACGLVSDEMKIIEKVSVPTGAGRDPALIVDDMASACRALIEKAGVGIGEIAAVGIASPGIAKYPHLSGSSLSLFFVAAYALRDYYTRFCAFFQ